MLHHIHKLYLFGSAASGDLNEMSDVDFLYEMDYSGFNFDEPATYPFDPFLEFFELKDKLELLFDRKVDLISNQNFRNKYFEEAVNKSQVLLFENERHQKVSA